MTTDGLQQSGGLAQQGSIDWVALSRTTVGFSVELLARYTRAGVEPLTVAIGQALFMQSRLPADAQRRLGLSVSKLKAYSSAAKALWFGVGFKHLIRTLMETEQGATLVAVSSSLMISYSCEFSAAVLKALCDKSMLPEKLTPALSQWGALVKLCAPAVIASQFPILVEGFSRLLVSNADKTAALEVAATSPSELAAAIFELAQLSIGKFRNLTLMGNSDCAWLAALAEWLFLLRVEIVDHVGNTLYQSKGSSHQHIKWYHVTIIRLEDGESGVRQSRQSMLYSRTQLVTPGNLAFSLRTETPYHLFYRGRSEWSSILTDTFGSFFHQLLEPKILPLFAQVLYSALYVDHEEGGKFRMNPWGDTLFINDSVQHQHRFMQMLDFAAARLPELTEVKKYGKDHAQELNNLDLDRAKMPRTRDKSRDSAFKAHFGRSKENIKDDLIAAGYSTVLVDACSCIECKGVHRSRVSEGAVFNVPTDFHQCLSRIVVAVFKFIWILSWLDIDDTLRPSSNGVLHLCPMKFSDSPHNIRGQTFKENAFAQVIRLFTGTYASVFGNPPAFALHGLCIYRPALEDPNRGVESQLRMRVVPGQIERNDKIHYRLDEASNPWLTYRLDETLDIGLTKSVLEMLGVRPLLQVAVEETLESTSLNTKLIVVPGQNAPVHWNSLFRPSVGDGEDRVPHQNSCFFGTIHELFTYISDSLNQFQCQNAHRSSKTYPLWGTDQTVGSWSGRCSVAELPWWTENHSVNDHQELLSISHSSGWVVAVLKNTDDVHIFLGSEPLLYCLLAKFVIIELWPSLLKLDDCLVCTSIGSTQGNERSLRERLRNIYVHYFSKAGQAQELELLPRRDIMFPDTEPSAANVNTE